MKFDLSIDEISFDVDFNRGTEDKRTVNFELHDVKVTYDLTENEFMLLIDRYPQLVDKLVESFTKLQ